MSKKILCPCIPTRCSAKGRCWSMVKLHAKPIRFCCHVALQSRQQSCLRLETAPANTHFLLPIGQNVTMSLIDWRIGNTSKAQQPAAAPGSNTATASLSAAPARPGAAAAPMPNSSPTPDPSGRPLPSGQARQLDPSTPFFLGGVTAESSAVQASAKYTVVDVPVRTISLATSSNANFGATVELAIAHRSGCMLCTSLFAGVWGLFWASLSEGSSTVRVANRGSCDCCKHAQIQSQVHMA